MDLVALYPARYKPLVLTVYLRHHWFVDILAGLAVAILAFIFSEYMLKLWKHIRARYGLSNR
jgi:membrane-associated phospholipid phosphatase